MQEHDSKACQTDELVTLFQGLNLGDRQALLRFARLRATKTAARMNDGAAAVQPLHSTVLQRSNVGGIHLFDAFRREV